jgi:tetratricopeptide (TPR) repeat protein
MLPIRLLALITFLIMSFAGSIQIALADAEADAKAKDNNDPVVKECIMNSMLRIPSAPAGAGNKETAERIVSSCSKVLADTARSRHYQAMALHYIGDAHSDLGEDQLAIDKLTKSIQLNSNEGDTYSSRAKVYKKMKMTNNAISDYEQAASLTRYATVKATIYRDIAVIHNDNGQYDQAIAYMTKAIEGAPDYAKGTLYKTRGAIWASKGDTGHAQADYAKANDLGSKN